MKVNKTFHLSCTQIWRALFKYDHVNGNPAKSWTTKLQRHVTSGFCVYIVCRDESFYEPPYVYHGEDAAEAFIDYVQTKAEELRSYLKNKEPMLLSPFEEYEFMNKTQCYICNENFDTSDKNLTKVRDHCHLTGKYRGAAHSICNLQLRINPKTVKIPVVFHNLKGYDSHLLLSAVKPRHGRIECIPSNSEKYISFTIGSGIKKVTFIDSLQFLLYSLDKLTGFMNN